MVEIYRILVAVDHDTVVGVLDALDGTHPHEALGTLNLVLSILYRRGFLREEEPMTVLEFLDLVQKQIQAMIDNPPPGFTDQDFEESSKPTEGCECPVCRALRAAQEEEKPLVH